MNKRVKKWMKRVLLWGIVLPVALVIALFVAIECLPQEYGDRVGNWILSLFIPVQDYEAASKDADLIFDQIKQKNYEAALTLCDSLEGRSKLPAISLNSFRAAAYMYMNQPKLGEFYFRKVLESFTGDDYELLDYATAGYHLSILLNAKNDYEGALKVLMPVIATTKEHEANILMPYDKVSTLLVAMGKNLVALGRFDEGEHQFQEAIEAYKRNASRYVKYDITASVDFTNDTTYYDVRQGVAAAASQAYLNKGLYERAATWLEVSKEALSYIQEHCDLAKYYFDTRLFRQQLTEARLLAHQGKLEEAEKVFRQCYDSSRDMSEVVKRECAHYLLETHQWQEAIDLYHRSDSSDTDSTQMTLDGITQTLVPQYQAWRNMGNNQKAIAMADSITSVLDSAIVRWRNSDAMELATIYDTQGKERKILEQRAENRLMTAISIAVTCLALLILAFAVYIFYQWRNSKKKNRVLVDQINETLEYKKKYRELKQKTQTSPLPLPEMEGSVNSQDEMTNDKHVEEVTISLPLREEQRGGSSVIISDMTELTDEQLFLCLRDLIENEQLFLKSDFGRQTLIEHTGLSKERIGAAFAQGSNSVSLPAYVRELRLDYAARLMNDQPDIAVELVSQASGFANADTFTRNFRAKFGMTPTTYKQTLNCDK